MNKSHNVHLCKKPIIQIIHKIFYASVVSFFFQHSTTQILGLQNVPKRHFFYLESVLKINSYLIYKQSTDLGK